MTSTSITLATTSVVIGILYHSVVLLGIRYAGIKAEAPINAFLKLMMASSDLMRTRAVRINVSASAVYSTRRAKISDPCSRERMVG